MAVAVSNSWLVPQFSIERSLAVGDFDSGARNGNGGPSAKVAVLDHLLFGIGRSLESHPLLNASFDGENVDLNETIHIGYAVDTNDGLISPAIRNASRLSVDEVAIERRRLVTAAFENALTASEAYDATFTVSNLGSLGVLRFNSLVMPPQVASLAVGAITAAGEMSLTLSCDHRVVNGAPAARFLEDVVDTTRLSFAGSVGA